MDEAERENRDEARRRLAAIVDASDDAIVSKDLNGLIRSWNPAAERLFGYSAEEAIGKSIQILLPAERADDFFSILGRIRRGERVEHYESTRRRKDGSLVEVSLTISPIYNEKGEVIGASKIARDLTALREIERERQRTRELFLATLGHDLRNPLNTIVVSLAYLQKHIPEPLRHVTTRMTGSANRMTRMIEQLLDFTRARLGGGITLDPRPGDLREICASVVDEVEAEHPNRVRLISEAAFQGDWDADRLAQVFSNLLGNAVDHGSLTSPIEVKLAHENGAARIDIRNCGKTIPDEARREIFEPFRRAGGQPQSPTRGLGLGLFITREIVRSHGGSIELESGGEETTFTVRLPIRPASR